MKNVMLFGGLAACCLLLGTGCIHHEQTVYRDPERVRVEFENDSAARHFYEALSHRGNKGRSERRTEISLPIVFDHETRVVTGANASFNEAVELCDTNKDGKITEMEARIFAESQRK